MLEEVMKIVGLRVIRKDGSQGYVNCCGSDDCLKRGHCNWNIHCILKETLFIDKTGLHIYEVEQHSCSNPDGASVCLVLE